MKFIYFIIVVLVINTCGYLSGFGQVPPQKLFMVYENEKLTEKQLKDRFEYLKLFTLRFSADSIVIPIVNKVPQMYMDYVRAFVDTLNRHIKRMPYIEKQIVKTSCVHQNMEVTFLCNFIQMLDSSIILNLTKEDAIRLGILDEYKTFEKEVFRWNKKINNMNIEKYQAVCELPKSIFLDSFYFNRILGKYYYALRGAILELNEKFKYE